MNGPGGYEWLRGEGGHEVLFIDERSDAAPQCLLERHVDRGNGLQSHFLKPYTRARAHPGARAHAQCNADPVALTSPEGLCYAGGCRADEEDSPLPGNEQ